MNGDEIIILKECESVKANEEIGFIFVILHQHNKDNVHSQEIKSAEKEQADQTL